MYQIEDQDKLYTIPVWDVSLIRTLIHWFDIPIQPRTFHVGFFNEFKVHVTEIIDDDLGLL